MHFIPLTPIWTKMALEGITVRGPLHNITRVEPTMKV